MSVFKTRVFAHLRDSGIRSGASGGLIVEVDAGGRMRAYGGHSAVIENGPFGGNFVSFFSFCTLEGAREGGRTLRRACFCLLSTF